MKIYMMMVLLFMATPGFAAMHPCETCSRQGASSPIYHCASRTHCPNNFSFHNAVDAKTHVLKTRLGKRFNIEFPLKKESEIWQCEQLPSESIVKQTDAGHAINGPLLYIITLEATKAGSMALAFHKIDTADKAQPVLDKKSVTIEVAP